MSTHVGILSTAHVHTGTYAAVLADLDDAELVGVSDDDSERGASFADTHETSFMAADELLDQVDGVVVCSTNAAHERWVTAAADAGVDVLCEKPLAPSVESATAMVDACEAAGVDLGLAMPLRFSEPARSAKSVVDAGEIGDLRAVSGTNRGKMPGGWFTDPTEAGGGAAVDHTVHVVDLIHWLTGERVAAVYAELGTRFYDLPVEDVNVLSMELESGAQFLLDGSWSRPEQWDYWGDATVELTGTEGVVAVDCFDQKVKRTRDSGEDPGIDSLFWGSDPNEGLVADFVDAAGGDRAPETSGREGADAVAVVEAIYESDDRGESVPVDYEY